MGETRHPTRNRRTRLPGGAAFLAAAALGVFVLGALPLGAQAASPGADADPVSLVGLTLEDLIGRFGVPQAVYPVRGDAAWQDDVVFTYAAGNFYLYRDRVWQVEVPGAFKFQVGDPRAAVFLALGSPAVDRGDSADWPLENRNWPLALHCDFDAEGRVKAIFIYRSDLDS